jgi:hypothetical protein
MKHCYALVLSFCLAVPQLMAQYCSPTFSSGCALWRNQTVNAGTIDWTLGATSCSTSDYTAQSTTVDAGTPLQMSVSSGNWTGCTVWVDLDNDQEFEHTENLYASYVGGDPSYLYEFTITIPVGTASGPHRMRVIAGWGSDGITEGPNGFGPCGAYQYGNFDDFTINVSGTTGIAERSLTDVSVAPNPSNGLVRVSLGAGYEQVIVRAMDGRIVQQVPIIAQPGSVDLDLSAHPEGVYVLECVSATATRTVRLLKQ